MFSRAVSKFCLFCTRKTNGELEWFLLFKRWHGGLRRIRDQSLQEHVNRFRKGFVPVLCVTFTEDTRTHCCVTRIPKNTSVLTVGSLHDRSAMKLLKALKSSANCLSLAHFSRFLPWTEYVICEEILPPYRGPKVHENVFEDGGALIPTLFPGACFFFNLN